MGIGVNTFGANCISYIWAWEEEVSDFIKVVNAASKYMFNVESRVSNSCSDCFTESDSK